MHRKYGPGSKHLFIASMNLFFLKLDIVDHHVTVVADGEAPEHAGHAFEVLAVDTNVSSYATGWLEN
jgi:hypothetical protein